MDPVLQRIGDVTIERVVSKKTNQPEGKDEPQNVEDSETDFSISGEELSEDDATDLEEMKHADDTVQIDTSDDYEHITLPSEVTIKRKGDEQIVDAKKFKSDLETVEINENDVEKETITATKLISKENEIEIRTKNIELLDSVDELTDDEYEESSESDDETEPKKLKSEPPITTTNDSIDIDKSDFIEKLTQSINFEDTITEIKSDIDKDNSTSKESDTSEYDYDITEKLREMGEISVQPVKKGEQSTRKLNLDEPESEVSVTAAKKITGSDSDDEEAGGMERKIGNLRRNIREVMDETKLDEATLAAQRQEMERLRRVQEQQRIIREVQRQIAFNRQNNRTQHKVISLLQGGQSSSSSTSSSVLRPGGSTGQGTVTGTTRGGPGAPGANTVLVKLPNGETKPMTRLPKGQNMFEMIRTHKSINLQQYAQNRSGCPQRNLISGKGHITPSVSIAPVAKKTPLICQTEVEKTLPKKKDVETIDVSSSDDDCIVLSEEEEEPEPEEDPHNSGMHTNDAYNVPDEQGRVLINVGHPENEADIFLASQIARVIKPHQIGGVRFLYDNVIESVERFNTSTGFGCILAHSMGLGKTLQVVCFSDIFLRHTSAKTILCIMPINTLQNWVAEYNMWLPIDATNSPLLAHGEVRPRNFNLHVLNDSHKSLAARARTIQEWHKDGGVLLIGYELYRLLSLKRNSRAKKKKKTTTLANNSANGGGDIVDLEEDDKNKQLFDEIHEALVKPGPDLVICDEGHRIKNSHASISQALKQIRSKRRVVLTGYPLQNNLLEYWCMVDFVRPNYLGTKTEFSNMFERPIQNGQCVDSTPQDVRLMRFRAHVLHSLLEGFVQRRSHAVLQVTLPQKEEYVMLVRMTTFQRQLYDTFMNDVVRTKTVPNPLKAFAVCCKIWNHPDVLYYFLKKREESDAVDIDLEEVAGAGTPSSSTLSSSTTPTATLTTTPKRSRGKTKAPKKEKEKKKISSLSSVEDSIRATAEGITSDSSSVSCSLPSTPIGSDSTAVLNSNSVSTPNQSSSASSTTPQQSMSPFSVSNQQHYPPYPPPTTPTPGPPPQTPTPGNTTGTPSDYNSYNQNYQNQYNNSNQFYTTTNNSTEQQQYGSTPPQGPPPPSSGGYYNQSYQNYQGNNWSNNSWSNTASGTSSSTEDGQQQSTTGFVDSSQYPEPRPTGGNTQFPQGNTNSQYSQGTGNNTQYTTTENQSQFPSVNSSTPQYPQPGTNTNTAQYPQQSPSQFPANNASPYPPPSSYPPTTQYPGSNTTQQYSTGENTNATQFPSRNAQFPPTNTQLPPPPQSTLGGNNPTTQYSSNNANIPYGSESQYSNSTSTSDTQYPSTPSTIATTPYSSGGPSNTSQYSTDASSSVQYPENPQGNSSQYPPPPPGGYSQYPLYTQPTYSESSSTATDLKQNFSSYPPPTSSAPPSDQNASSTNQFYSTSQNVDTKSGSAGSGMENESFYNTSGDNVVPPVSTAVNLNYTEIKTEPNNQYYTSSSNTMTTTTSAPSQLPSSTSMYPPYQGNQPFEIKTEPGQQSSSYYGAPPPLPPVGYNQQAYGYGPPPPPSYQQMYGGYGAPPIANYNQFGGPPPWGQHPTSTVSTITTPTTDVPMELKEEKKEDIDVKLDVKDLIIDVKKEEDIKIEKEEKSEPGENEEGLSIKDDELLQKEVLPTAKLKEDAGINYDWAMELLKGYVPGCIENSAKMEILFCIVRESMALGDRILLFSQSLFTLNLIEEFLQKSEVPGQFDSTKWARNVNYYRLDGSTSALEREKLINEFNANSNIYLFMVSTRAGSLGINLVGANRVVVFDASWNPCHDTQAVCRVYRYGQKKPCFVYRLVMDNCLEKKIYDRQINKQGMSDRVVDECNPDAHLSMKDVTNLCWDDEKETEVKDFSNVKDKYIDIVMQKVLDNHSQVLSKEPFQHESLLVDRKEKKLSQAEKRMAKRSYEMEKQAVNNAARSVSYNYYGGTTGTGMMHHRGSMRTMANDGSMHNKPIASVRPMQAELNSQLVRDGQRRTRWIPAEVWQRQGMTAQEMTLPLDVVIPTNGGERGNIVLKAGQKVLVLKSPKGIYMQLECGKIVAIRTAMKMRGNSGAGTGGGNSGSCGGNTMGGQHLGGKISPGAGTPKSSDEASSDGSLLKKVNPRQQKPIPLPLKNNSAVTIIPKISMTTNQPPKIIKPFTQVSGGGVGPPAIGGKIPPTKAPIRPINARIQNIRYPPKVGSPQQKQFGKAKPFNLQKQDTDVEMKNKSLTDEESETHVIQSSDEDQPVIPPPTSSSSQKDETITSAETEMELNDSNPKIVNEFDNTMDVVSKDDGDVVGDIPSPQPSPLPPQNNEEITTTVPNISNVEDNISTVSHQQPPIYESSNEICIDINKPIKRDVKPSPGLQILEVKSLDKSEMIPVDTFQESHQLNTTDLFNKTTLINPKVTKTPPIAPMIAIPTSQPKSSLKNYRHNFSKSKATTSGAVTPPASSALSRLEQTTSSIGSGSPGDLKQPSLQSSLDKITADSSLVGGNNTASTSLSAVLVASELSPEITIISKKTQPVMPLKDGIVVEQQNKPKPKKNIKKKPIVPAAITPPTIELDSSDNESPTKLDDKNSGGSSLQSQQQQHQHQYQQQNQIYHQPHVLPPPTDPNNMYTNYNYGAVPPQNTAPPYGYSGYTPQPPYGSTSAPPPPPSQQSTYQNIDIQSVVPPVVNNYMEAKNTSSISDIKSKDVTETGAQQSSIDYRRDQPSDQKSMPPSNPPTQQSYPPPQQQQQQQPHMMGPPPMNNMMNYGQPSQYPPPNYAGMPYTSSGYQPYQPQPYNQNFSAAYGSAFHRPEIMPPYPGHPPGPPASSTDNYGTPGGGPTAATTGGYPPPPQMRPSYPSQYTPYPPPPPTAQGPPPQQPHPMYPAYNEYNQYNAAPGFNQYMNPGAYPTPTNPNPPPS